ncbi:MAG: hypothetical protein K1X89_26590 [Myxococcaceae bacterium]|nr:hypothetical protein [Myxococcaceae bacterium]
MSKVRIRDHRAEPRTPRELADHAKGELKRVGRHAKEAIKGASLDVTHAVSEVVAEGAGEHVETAAEIAAAASRDTMMTVAAHTVGTVLTPVLWGLSAKATVEGARELGKATRDLKLGFEVHDPREIRAQSMEVGVQALRTALSALGFFVPGASPAAEFGAAIWSARRERRAEKAFAHVPQERAQLAAHLETLRSAGASIESAQTALLGGRAPEALDPETHALWLELQTAKAEVSLQTGEYLDYLGGHDEQRPPKALGLWVGREPWLDGQLETTRSDIAKARAERTWEAPLPHEKLELGRRIARLELRTTVLEQTKAALAPLPKDVRKALGQVDEAGLQDTLQRAADHAARED